MPFGMAAVVFCVGVGRLPAARGRAPQELAAALALGLELLLAAGLLRLSAADDLVTLAGVAAIVLLRKVLGTGIRQAVRAIDSPRGPARRRVRQS